MKYIIAIMVAIGTWFIMTWIDNNLFDVGIVGHVSDDFVIWAITIALTFATLNKD